MEINNCLFELQIVHRSRNDFFCCCCCCFCCALPLFRINVICLSLFVFSIFYASQFASCRLMLWLIFSPSCMRSWRDYCVYRHFHEINNKTLKKISITKHFIALFISRYFIDFLCWNFFVAAMPAKLYLLVMKMRIRWKLRRMHGEFEMANVSNRTNKSTERAQRRWKDTFISIFHGLNAFSMWIGKPRFTWIFHFKLEFKFKMNLCFELNSCWVTFCVKCLFLVKIDAINWHRDG